MFVGEVTCDLERTLAPQIERHVQRRANRLRKANHLGAGDAVRCGLSSFH